MEKLLHERLRERVRELPPDILNVLGREFHCEGTGWIGIVSAIADEIERYYIPRPRDDSGEPWKIDDPCVAKGKEGEIAGFDGDDFINVIHDDSFFWYDKRYVKRPTPKVYDADEVEIKVGDALWCITDGDEVVVRDFYRSSDGEWCFYAVGRGEIGFYADKHTHERPVFDAEGERICKGDMVWSIDPSCRESGIVEHFNVQGHAVIRWSDGQYSNHCGNTVTKREPDSYQKAADQLEAIIDDSDELIDTEWTLKLKEVHERFTALIERGA